MAELLIFWGEKEAQSFVWEISGESETLDNGPIHQLVNHEILKDDLACVAEMAQALPVSLVLPSVDVTSMQIEVPNKPTRMLRKMVPYIVEDDLASSVEDLFFALADKLNGNSLAVRIIEKNYLESILNLFQKAEVKLSNIFVDIDLISSPDEGIKLVNTSSRCLNVDSDNNRWACFQEDYPWLIQKEMAAIEAEELPIAIPMEIYSETETDQLIHKLPVGRFAVTSHQVDSIHKYLMNENNSAINLLQAEYEVKKENSEISNFLFQVAKIAGVVLAAHLLYQGFSIYTLSEQKEQLEKQKYTLYKQAFPNSKNIRRPVKEMNRYFNSLGSSSGGGDFHSLLGTITEVLDNLEEIYPTNISYDAIRNEMKLDVIASDLTVLDKYAETLKKTGHNVEKSSETQRGDGYSSRLTISK